MSKRNKRLSLSFTYQPSTETGDAVLVRYLNSKTSSQRKEMILQAVRAYWGTNAAIALGVKPDDLQIVAQLSISSLLAQQKNISRQLDLPEIEVFDRQSLSSIEDKLDRLLLRIDDYKSKVIDLEDDDDDDEEDRDSVIDPATFGMKGAFD